MSSHFEGTEKRIEISFKITRLDLFSVPIDEIKSRVLKKISCAVIGEMERDEVRAYLLSESSLFVFRDKILLKTCGLTTLLYGVPELIDLVREFIGESAIEYVLYSRRNFKFPDEQKTPHSSWGEEVSFLKEMFPDGVSKTIGVEDTFHVFLADMRDKNCDRQINFTEVAMRNLDPDVMKYFFMSEDSSSDKSFYGSGMNSIIPDGSEHDGFQFEPCGFSSNSLKEKNYYTIHITPESSFSYVSFETNDQSDKIEMYDAVVGFFKPGEYGLTLIADTCLLDDFIFETVSITDRVSLAFHEDIVSSRG